MTHLAKFAAAAALMSLALIACQQREAQSGTDNDAATAPVPATAPSDDAPLAKRATDPALEWGPCPPAFPQGCEIAVLHGDPAKPNADVFLRVPGGYEIPPHSHSSAERMILVSGELEVTYRGAAPATLDVGSYAFGPAGMPHRASCRSSEPCILFIAFEGPVDVEPFEGDLG